MAKRVDDQGKVVQYSVHSAAVANAKKFKDTYGQEWQVVGAPFAAKPQAQAFCDELNEAIGGCQDKTSELVPVAN